MRYFRPLTVLLLLTRLATIAQMDCRSPEYRQIQLIRDPRLAAAIQEIESFTRHQLQTSSIAVAGESVSQANQGLSLITIPVVVHIIYNSSQQNISDEQVQSQIDVLNRDYRKLNPDTAGIPAYYSALAADCGFRFGLAKTDTNGAATTGIIRRHTNASSFSINDDVKFTARGGDNAWDRDRYLNIWVCNLTGGTLGYSSIVGCRKETDGVVVSFMAFGTTGTAIAPFNLGRTTTHETGHWLNMIHIWGDAFCGDDEVADTPPQQTSTHGDPSGIIISCSNGPFGNMYMNYMDFTDDAGMHMFTYGQRARMRTLFAPGGFRYPILSSAALAAVPAVISTVPVAPPADNAGMVLRIYPNPAVNTVSVVMTAGTRTGSLLEVYNQVGQKLMTTNISSLNIQLNVSALPGGVYIVRINGGQPGNNFKMVKM